MKASLDDNENYCTSIAWYHQSIFLLTLLSLSSRSHAVKIDHVSSIIWLESRVMQVNFLTTTFLGFLFHKTIIIHTSAKISTDYCHPTKK
jgi:hypothetical protein